MQEETCQPESKKPHQVFRMVERDGPGPGDTVEAVALGRGGQHARFQQSEVDWRWQCGESHPRAPVCHLTSQRHAARPVGLVSLASGIWTADETKLRSYSFWIFQTIQLISTLTDAENHCLAKIMWNFPSLSSELRQRAQIPTFSSFFFSSPLCPFLKDYYAQDHKPQKDIGTSLPGGWRNAVLPLAL